MQRKSNPSTECSTTYNDTEHKNNRQTLAKIKQKRRNNTSLNHMTHIRNGHFRHYYYY